MAAPSTRYHAALTAASAAETSAQQAVARTLRLRMILMDELRRMQETLDASKRKLGESLLGRVDLGAVGAVARYCGDTAGRGRELVGRLAQLERELAGGRVKLNEAVRRRRSLELLAEQELRARRRARERSEEAALDDLSATRFFQERLSGRRGVLAGAPA
ncbi:flagellar FliJ family protein [Phycisphaera mikurensis]|uniref:Flagellar FliJ protein n=1 Tax=Phycisphaera mikurensis (strain NBRC 102666 / KCTC 22515 / FYK2301M01) TaxID=1142394 RepID=I0IGE1_PHYMF|nr:flagellar FliJ family protein [Phycisphaera mikurensis]MBB6440293.1 hypothetical protein [Phycisphaera mikurensis]BAM04329.1 FliJ family protein [Phycisphaera mikurensis NBRC 102666]